MAKWELNDDYVLTSPFGPRKNPVGSGNQFHKGIDLVVSPSNGPLYAFVPGEVVFASEGLTGTGLGGYGLVVAVKDKYGCLHIYAHMSSIVVRLGQMVDRGQMIGRQGSTGKSTGPHLHYEVRKKISPSFGWTESPEGVHEPTQYLKDYVAKEVKPVSKFVPIVTKERIIAVNGKLQFISLANANKPYAKKGTDVRLVRLPKGKVNYRFVAVKDGKVSDMVKQHGADLGFNFPFFSDKLPVGNVWDGTKLVNGAYGKTVDWHSLVFRGANTGSIEKPTKFDGMTMSLPGAPLLVKNGKAVWNEYLIKDQVNPDIGRNKSGNLVRSQRTFVGIASNGDLLLAIADGRTGYDLGLTVEEMALYMLNKGAVMALNGDGGGSTILANKTGGINQRLNTGVNERRVHHAVLVFGI